VFSGQCDMGGLAKPTAAVLPLPSAVFGGSGPDRRS